MCLRCSLGEVLRIHGVPKGDRSKPGENTGHTQHDIAQDYQEFQKLTGRITALYRFISKATDKCLPFFKTLMQAFAWTDECKAAFQELKRYLSNPPFLSPSNKGENLYLYLVVSATVVSVALIQEEGKTQLPIYYVSQAFQGAEAKYLRIEKISFALIVASRKL